MSARPVTITIEDGDVALRYVKRASDPFMWDLEARFGADERWIKMPLQSENMDGRDVAWNVLSLVMRDVATDDEEPDPRADAWLRSFEGLG